MISSFRDQFYTFNVWFSFAISIIATIFLGLFEFLDDVKDLATAAPLFYMFFVGLVLAMIGSILVIYKMKWGGIMMLAGGCLMVGYQLLQSPPNSSLAIMYGLPYLVPGVLLLLPISERK